MTAQKGSRKNSRLTFSSVPLPHGQEKDRQADETDFMLRKKDSNRLHVALYISEMTAELSQMARQSHLEILEYLLDMVKIEAANMARRDGHEAEDSEDSFRN